MNLKQIKDAVKSEPLLLFDEGWELPESLNDKVVLETIFDGSPLKAIVTLAPDNEELYKVNWFFRGKTGEFFYLEDYQSDSQYEIEDILEEQIIKFTKFDDSKKTKSIRRRSDAASDLRKTLEDLGGDPKGLSTKQLEEEIAKLLWEKDHPGEEFPDQVDPMLAHEVTSKGADYVKENFKPSDWILQRKENGMRFILNIGQDGSVKMTSRGKSVQTYRFNELDDRVLSFHNLKSPFTGKTILDGEIICQTPNIDTGSTVTTSTLQSTVAMMHASLEKSLKWQEEYGSLVYKVFDILYLSGEDVQNRPYEERHELVAVAVSLIKEANPQATIETVETIENWADAWETFQEAVGKGWEGIMAKKRKAPYLQGTRSHDLLKIKGFCIDGEARVWMSDNSWKKIREIEVGDLVKSWNGNTVCDRKVLNVFDNGLFPIENWVKLYHGYNGKKCVGTKAETGHAFYITQNHKVFDNGEFRALSTVEQVSKYLPVMSDYHYQAILGWILSDGIITSEGIVTMLQKQGDYAEFTKHLFRDFITKSSTAKSGKGSNIERWSLAKRYSNLFSKFRKEEQDYEMIIAEMNEIAIAYAFMGDGSGRAEGRGFDFAFQSWNENQIKAFQAKLQSFGIESVTQTFKNVKTGAALGVRINSEWARKFVELIAPHVHPSMRYKFGHWCSRNNEELPSWIEPPVTQKTLVKVPTIQDPVVKVRGGIRKSLRGYDIQVEHDSNYFVEGVCVHNSTIDGFITGAVPSTKGKGLEDFIGGFRISCYVDGELREIAAISNIDMATRVDATVTVNGEPELNPDYLNRCLELIGQDFNQKSMRLNSARINEWRPDKTPENCTISKEEMRFQGA